MSNHEDLPAPDIGGEDRFDFAVYAYRPGAFGSPIDRGPGFRTFMTTGVVNTIVKDLTTFEEAVLRRNARWPASQVIQREIDTDRVREIAQRYLEQKGNLKYFPPLTAVLLPRSETDNTVAMDYVAPSDPTNAQLQEILRAISLEMGYTDVDTLRPAFDKIRNSIEQPVSGMFLVPLYPNAALHFVLWDRLQLYAIVIDGQHRLKALQTAADADPNIGSFKQDIVFIDVPHRAISNGESPTRIVRQVFVDVNSNAVPVSVVKRYIMDDKDLSSLLLQAIVDDSIEDNITSGHCLRPQLVDWHSLNLKHEMPHITSILVLYQLISDYLVKHSLSSIDQLRNLRRIRNWVDRLNDRFQVDERISRLQTYRGTRQLSVTLQEYKAAVNGDDQSDDADTEESAIFEYDYSALRVAQDAFRELYAQAIVVFFRTLEPFDAVHQWLEANSAFDPDFTLYHALIKLPKKRDQAEASAVKSASDHCRETFSADYGLLYTVLGQKALFSLLMERIDKEVQVPDGQEILATAKRFISEANEVIGSMRKGSINLFAFDVEKNTSVLPKLDDRTLRKYSVEKYRDVAASFWEGIIYRGPSIVYNTQGIGAFSAFWSLLLEFNSLDAAARNDYHDGLATKLHSLKYHRTRIMRALRDAHDLDDQQQSSVADQVIYAKADYLNTILRSW